MLRAQVSSRRICLALMCLTAALSVCAVASADEARPATQPAPTGSALAAPAPANALDFNVTTIDGRAVNLSDYKGKVVLIVNVASKCGFTPQYAELEEVYEKYRERGFAILAFPANNFKQEPDSDQKIKAFVTERFQVTFDMMSKISVKGQDQSPLYRYLTAKDTGGKFSGDIEWNFTKILIDRSGRPVARFPSKVTPKDPAFISAIEKALDFSEPATTPKPTVPDEK